MLCILQAFPLLRHPATGRNEGVNLSPGGTLGCWLAGLTGFAITLLAIVTSMIPPVDSGNPGLFLLKVVGGSALLIGIGLLFYRHGRSRPAIEMSPPKNIQARQMAGLDMKSNSYLNGGI